MTPEQLKARNIRIGEGQKRAWTDPEIRERRSRAIAKGWDDPLVRALQSKRKTERAR